MLFFFLPQLCLEFSFFTFYYLHFLNLMFKFIIHIMLILDESCYVHIFGFR